MHYFQTPSPPYSDRPSSLKKWLFTLSTFTLLPLIWSCGSNEQIDSAKQVQVLTKQVQSIDFSKGILCSFLDSKGMLWFGSGQAGLYRYDGHKFSSFSKIDGLQDLQVMAIFEDKNGTLWFGTGKGLHHYDGKTFTQIPIPQQDTSSLWLDKVYPVVNPNQVSAIAEDRDGILWIGTNGGGAYSYDGQTFTPYLRDIGAFYEDSLKHNAIQGITMDTAGNLWIGSMSHGGATCYDGKTFTSYMPEDGLPYDQIRMITLLKNGDIAFGTLHHGYSIYDSVNFTNYDESNGLIFNNVRDIYEAQNGDLWIAGGVEETSIYNGESFRSFETKDGRAIDKIRCIVGDRDGRIWLGGMHGLWRYDGEEVADMSNKENW